MHHPSRWPLASYVAVGAAIFVAACSGEGGSSSTNDDSGVPSPIAEAGADGAGAESGPRGAGPLDWTVNGHDLTGRERDALMVIAFDVVPRLGGARDDRLTMASRGAWWALKEGTWERAIAGVVAYSNCNAATGDHEIGPLETCETGKAWQVGLAAVQVPGRTAAQLETLAGTLFPGTPPSKLLADVAVKAAQPKAVSDAIVASTGPLRASWLLRVPAIGVATVVSGEIVPECIDGTKSWCFGTAWDETKKFAPTKAAALVSIADLKRILGTLAE